MKAKKNQKSSTCLICGPAIPDIMRYEEKTKDDSVSVTVTEEWDVNIKNSRYSQTNMTYLISDIEKEKCNGFIKPSVFYYDEKMDA